MSGLREAVARYESQFRPVIHNDLLEISKLVQQMARPEWSEPLAKMRADFERQMAAFRTPLINIQDSLKSFRAMGELAAMGAAVRTIAPFEPALVLGLRAEIGDWREAEIDVSPLLDDPAGRVAVFEEQGFNSELTDFPTEGFEAALSITHIELGLVAAELAPPPAESVPGFNKGAYEWLFVFERELRLFIEKRLSSIDSKPWQTRLPAGMHDKWQAKRAEALAKGEIEQPLIHYADFADYTDIILSRANWRDCFRSTFKHEEAVREGFNRLRPIRIVVAHMRVLTAAEWLTLNLEVRRFLRAIGVLRT
ncbi:hypothetical protein V1291_004151 [Nitrobacteraceae bacterium AZCC 1564]